MASKMIGRAILVLIVIQAAALAFGQVAGEQKTEAEETKVTASAPSASAVDDREWMTGEEMMEKVFEREFTLPAEFGAEMRKIAETHPELADEGWKSLQDKFSGGEVKAKFMDLATVLGEESPHCAPLYAMMAKNDDPVASLMGMISQIMVMKDEAAAGKIAAMMTSKDFAGEERLVIRNICHGIGIDPDRDDAKEIFRFLSTMRESQRHRPKIGDPAPDFEIPTLDGKMIRLSDYRGKVVLLHFWSTSCGPCIAEFPELEIQLKAWKAMSPDFVAIGVSLDDNLPLLKTFLAKYDMAWIDVCDGGCWGSVPAKLFYISMIPSDVVIDREGKVADYSHFRIDAMLKESKPIPISNE